MKKCCAIVAPVRLFLLAGLVCLVVSGCGQKHSESVSSVDIERADILKTVPTDAAVVLSFADGKDALKLFTGEEYFFRTLLDGSSQAKAFINGLDNAGVLRSHPMVVSIHYTGCLEPLFVIQCGRTAKDTTDYQRRVFAVADENGMQKSLLLSESPNVMLISASATLIESSLRHLEGEVSLMDNPAFETLASWAGTDDAIFIANRYSAKLISPNLKSPAADVAPFFKSLGDWTAFSFADISRRRASLEGRIYSSSDERSYISALDGQDGGRPHFFDVLPNTAVGAVSVSTRRSSDFRKKYEEYLDASGKMRPYKSACDSYGQQDGVKPLVFAEGVKEVIKASWVGNDGSVCQAVLFRVRKKSRGDAILSPNQVRGYGSLLFGNLFACDDESSQLRWGRWLAVGSSSDLSDLLRANDEERTLDSRLETLGLDDILDAKGHSVSVFCSVRQAMTVLDDCLKPLFASEVRDAVADADDIAAALTYGQDGMELEIVRPKLRSNKGRKD